MFCPPSFVLIVYRHEDGVLRWICFCKYITCVSSDYCYSIESSQRAKHTGGWLFHTASICVSQSNSVAITFPAIASTTCLWCGAIFEAVGPYKRQNSWIFELPCLSFWGRDRGIASPDMFCFWYELVGGPVVGRYAPNGVIMSSTLSPATIVRTLPRNHPKPIRCTT